MIFLKRELRRLKRRLDGIINTDTNAKLTVDTSDRDINALAVSINAALERGRLALVEKERAEAALKRAVTNISHDLRTPLTSAAGYLQMLRSSDIDEETRAKYLEIIHGRLEVLSALMNNLFEFALVIEGNTVINVQKINICNVLRDVLSENYIELENKGFTVDADIPDAPETRLCDDDAIRRVLQNLIKNVSVHGRDYLGVSIVGGAIEIANKADGLAELDTDRIFERFYIADASRTSKNTGLGLAIAHELITRMGGNISASADGDMLTMKVELKLPLDNMV